MIFPNCYNWFGLRVVMRFVDTLHPNLGQVSLAHGVIRAHCYQKIADTAQSILLI